MLERFGSELKPELEDSFNEHPGTENHIVIAEPGLDIELGRFPMHSDSVTNS